MERGTTPSGVSMLAAQRKTLQEAQDTAITCKGQSDSALIYRLSGTSDTKANYKCFTNSIYYRYMDIYIYI